MVFAYMGPGAPPPLPQLEWTLLPEANTLISKRVQECNWFQALEGGIDSSHISFLHAPISHEDTEIARELDKASFGIGEAVQTADRAPRFEIGRHRLRRPHRRATVVAGRAVLLAHQPVPHAVLHHAAHRPRRARSPSRISGCPWTTRNVVNWMVTWHPDRALTSEERALHIAGKGAHVCDYAPATSEAYGDVRTAANRDNDYGMDWEAHRTRMFCGIPGFGVQDQAVQESQGPIVDRIARAPGLERHRDHPRAPASSWPRRGRCAITDVVPAENPESFCVRSASVVLPPEARLGRGRHGSRGRQARRPAHPRLIAHMPGRMAGRVALVTGGEAASARPRAVSSRRRARR